MVPVYLIFGWFPQTPPCPGRVLSLSPVYLTNNPLSAPALRDFSPDGGAEAPTPATVTVTVYEPSEFLTAEAVASASTTFVALSRN